MKIKLLSIYKLKCQKECANLSKEDPKNKKIFTVTYCFLCFIVMNQLILLKCLMVVFGFISCLHVHLSFSNNNDNNNNNNNNNNRK